MKLNNKKPKFGGAIFQIIDNIISLSTTIITFLNYPDDFSNIKKGILVIGTYILSYVICLLLYNVIYTFLLYQYSKSLEVTLNNQIKKNEMLKSNNIIIKNDYMNLYKDFGISLQIGNFILDDIKNAIYSKKSNDTKFLEQLYKIIALKQETRTQLKGDNKYEK